MLPSLLPYWAFGGEFVLKLILVGVVLLRGGGGRSTPALGWIVLILAVPAGRLLDYLDRTGLARNTLVMYTSDQGWYLGEHGWYDKRWMYEESLRMPRLVRWPAAVRPGSSNADLCQNLDFAATMLAAAGETIPTDMQGCSMLPLLKGHSPRDWRQSIYYHYYEHPGAHNVQRHEGVDPLAWRRALPARSAPVGGVYWLDPGGGVGRHVLLGQPAALVLDKAGYPLGHGPRVEGLRAPLGYRSEGAR